MSAARTALQRDSGASGLEPAAHSGERIRRLVGKAGSDTMQPSLHPEVFINFLHGTQEGQQVAPNPQSSTTEQVHHPQEVQDGNSFRDPQIAVCGPVGHVLGPQGRLPSHPGTAQRPGFPLFFLQGPSLPFCGDAFRPFYGPENLHARVEGPGGLPPPKRNGGGPRSFSVSTPRQGTEGPGSIGQHHGGGLHQSPGRNSLLQPMETVLGSLPLDVAACNHLGSNSLTRDLQHQSGCPLPSVAAGLRVDVESSHLLSTTGQMPDLSGGGSVRLPGEQPDTTILQPIPPPEGMARECPVLPLEGTRILCLSSASTGGESATQDRIRRNSISPTRRPVLASQSLVPQASQVVGGPALQAATTPGPTFSSRPGLMAPIPFGPSLGCLAPIRESFIKEGFSEEAALMAAQGRRPSTLNLYNRRSRLFGEWCSDRSIGPSKASLGQIADFLLYLFHLGRKVNTVRGYRSAIAAIHSGFPDGGSISTSVSLNHLIKGTFLERPTVRTLVPPWSLSSVLETLAGPPFEPLHRCSLKLLTLKTVFLA